MTIEPEPMKMYFLQVQSDIFLSASRGLGSVTIQRVPDEDHDQTTLNGQWSGSTPGADPSEGRAGVGWGQGYTCSYIYNLLCNIICEGVFLEYVISTYVHVQIRQRLHSTKRASGIITSVYRYSLWFCKPATNVLISLDGCEGWWGPYLMSVFFCPGSRIKNIMSHLSLWRQTTLVRQHFEDGYIVYTRYWFSARQYLH